MKINVRELDVEFSDEIKRDCFSGDAEVDHGNADAILVDLLEKLGFKQTAKAYYEVSKWYS